MRPLFLLQFLYKFLGWSGRADARPTEFAPTVLTADRPGAGAETAGADTAASGAPLTHIGRYELKGRLGSGGLGEVFEAWDPLLSREVAVKTLRLQLDPELRAQLDDHILNEARAAAGLSHPHIVTVFDAGLCAPGVYIAMERLRGRDLRQALVQGWRPSPMQAAQLARRVAEALAYAHAKGVVHCDIKPANIFLDAFDRPKVLDFGIARVTHDKALPPSDAPLFGTPHYLAPEQLRHGQADARTDIRALGVVLYELLTGRKAFAGDTVEQVVNAVLINHPAPAHVIHEHVPRTLSNIAARAMAHDPAQRFASAEDMASALRGWCERHTPRPVQAASAEASAFASSTLAAASAAPSPRAARRRLGLGWAAAGAAVCLAAVAWLWWLPGRPGKAQPTPALAQQTAPATGTSIPNSKGSGSEPPARPARPAAGEPKLAAAERTAAQRPPAARPPSAPKPTAAKARAGSEAAAAANGAVLLAISPWGEVEVNGQLAGTTPPLTRLSLPTGSHTITVKNEDFPSYTTTVVVQADKPALVRHRFAQ